MIKKQGKEYILYSEDGSKILGRHPTKSKAIAQEIAINISKHKKDK